GDAIGDDVVVRDAAINQSVGIPRADPGQAHSLAGAEATAIAYPHPVGVVDIARPVVVRINDGIDPVAAVHHFDGVDDVECRRFLVSPFRVALTGLSVRSRSRPPSPRLALSVRTGDLHREAVRLRWGFGCPSSPASGDCASGAGSAAGSAVPSMTFAASPARGAGMVWVSSMGCSVSSSLIGVTPPLCSTFSLRRTTHPR